LESLRQPTWSTGGPELGGCGSCGVWLLIHFLCLLGVKVASKVHRTQTVFEGYNMASTVQSSSTKDCKAGEEYTFGLSLCLTRSDLTLITTAAKIQIKNLQNCLEICKPNRKFLQGK